MKLYIFLIVLFCNNLGLHSQIHLTIDELRVSNVLLNMKDDIIDEDEFDEPYVNLECSIGNSYDTATCIYPSKADINILFNYKGIEYRSSAEAMPFTDEEKLFISKQESINFRVGAYILLGTKLWKENTSDYRMILLGLLPTLRVEYKDSIHEVLSTRIKKVTIL